METETSPARCKGGDFQVNVDEERTRSLWSNTDVVPDAETLRRAERADVAVIGGGIAGLSVAYELVEKGLDVVLVDRGQIGKGMTARTTAHLAPICDDGAEEIIKRRGLAAAKIAWQSQSAAVDRIEEIIAARSINCGFRRLNAYLFPAHGTPQSQIDSELKALKQIDVAAEKTGSVPFEGLQSVGCILYQDQATFQPLQYLRGLCQAIRKGGGRLYSNTCVTEIEEKAGAVTLRANGKPISAAAAVVATNSPINDRVTLHTKLAPYRTYAMAFTIDKDALPDALYWDTLDPYHYVRQHPGPGSVNYLIVGGADHKTGEADDGLVRFEALEAWIRALLPNLGRETHRWSGQVLDTLDYSSYTGRNPGSQNVYVHTGDSGQGMTHGAMAGLLICDLITRSESPWADTYDPARTPMSGLTTLVSENITAIKNLSEYIAPSEVSSLDEIERGKGAIVREGLTKIAAYRDDRGKLHMCSAKCTHLGCHVHWNSLERCWDCPCHGSQFDIDGTALNGPAVAPLAGID